MPLEMNLMVRAFCETEQHRVIKIPCGVLRHLLDTDGLLSTTQRILCAPDAQFAGIHVAFRDWNEDSLNLGVVTFVPGDQVTIYIPQHEGVEQFLDALEVFGADKAYTGPTFTLDVVVVAEFGFRMASLDWEETYKDLCALWRNLIPMTMTAWWTDVGDDGTEGECTQYDFQGETNIPLRVIFDNPQGGVMVALVFQEP